jgi:hypothetical protein
MDDMSEWERKWNRRERLKANTYPSIYAISIYASGRLLGMYYPFPSLISFFGEAALIAWWCWCMHGMVHEPDRYWDSSVMKQ